MEAKGEVFVIGKIKAAKSTLVMGEAPGHDGSPSCYCYYSGRTRSRGKEGEIIRMEDEGKRSY